MLTRAIRKHVILTCISVALVFVIAFSAFADMLLPEASGEKVKIDGSLTVDCSHMNDGYIMAKAQKSSKKLKVRIKTSGATLNYDLNGDGEFEVFPLQFGSGKYQVSLYKNVSGKKYSEEGKVSMNVDMDDENKCFLYPNQYVPYSADTAAVVKASELCAGMTDAKQIFMAIRGFVESYFAYDYVKMVTVKAGQMPDIDGTWEKQLGICQDLAAVTVAMLRSQGVYAKMVIGTVGGNSYHAWVNVLIGGEWILYDPTAELNASSKNEIYTTERYY